MKWINTINKHWLNRKFRLHLYKLNQFVLICRRVFFCISDKEKLEQRASHWPVLLHLKGSQLSLVPLWLSERSHWVEASGHWVRAAPHPLRGALPQEWRFLGWCSPPSLGSRWPHWSSDSAFPPRCRWVIQGCLMQTSSLLRPVLRSCCGPQSHWTVEHAGRSVAAPWWCPPGQQRIRLHKHTDRSNKFWKQSFKNYLISWHWNWNLECAPHL